MPATLAGVNRAAIVGFICLRVGSLVQLVVGLSSGSLTRAQEPWLSASAAGLVLVESLVVCVLMWRGGRASRPDLVLLDVTTLCLVYLIQVVYAHDAARAVTWEGWAFGVGVGFLIPIACLPRWTAVTLAGVAVVGTYWATTLPDAVAYNQAATVVANGSGLAVNLIAMRLLWLFLVRLGTRADTEAAAAQAAREELAARNQRIVHELHHQTGSLVTFLNELDPADLREDRGQLRELSDALWISANRARAELSGATRAQDGDGTLGAALRAVAGQCPGLHVTCTTYQVDDLHLAASTLAAIDRAVQTLLANVLQHSASREATIYASVQNGSYSVSITDSGAGFDPDATPVRVGLGEVAGRHLTAHGLATSIRSAPGQGTTVTITGAR